MTILKSPFFWILTVFTLFYVSILRLAQLHCFSYYDLGIYSEALSRIQISDLNPFIPGRNLRIFNDHFDPILIPFSFLERFIPAPDLGISIEFALLALCWLPIKLLRDRQKISSELAVFSYAFLVLNNAMINALHWPFHPTTWACLPLVSLFSFYILDHFAAVLVSFFILCFFREEFPLIGFFLSALYLAHHRKKQSGILLGLTLLWCGFTFGLRPKLFGETSNYGYTLATEFIRHPFRNLRLLFGFGSLRMFLNWLAPLFLVLSWPAFWRHRLHFLKVLFIAAPLFGIRYASNAWGYHYGPAALIALFFAFLPALNESQVSPWRKKLAWAAIFIIFSTPLTKDLWDGFLSQGRFHFEHANCPLDERRLREIETAQTWIQNHSIHRILTNNSLAVSQLKHSTRIQEVYILGSPNNSNQGVFDGVLVEKPPLGDAWLVSPSRLTALIEIWKQMPGVRVITDNEILFLAEGPITPDR